LVAARTGSALSSITRGQDGTTAASHAAGATCYPVFTATDADQANKVASTLTTKGDVLVTDGSVLNRLAVGSDGAVLMADSAQTNGLAWVGNGLSNRNVVINGAMQVAQRGTSSAAVGATGGYFTADRWRYGQSGNDIVYTQSVEADAPTGSGFRNSLKMLVTTADASLDAGDLSEIFTRFEGQNLQQFAKGTASAKPFALSFWVKSNTTGTYIAELVDNDNNRSVSASYTISVSATWEKKTITFPADATGVFDNDNAASLDMNFYLSAGTTYTSGTLQTTWGTVVTANRAVGQTNIGATLSNYWQVTGVQLEVGSVATPFEFEDYGTTLAKCQRYYYRTGQQQSAARQGPSGGFFSTTGAYLVAQHPTTMRTTPTAIESNLLTVFDYNADIAITALALTANGSTSQASLLTATIASGGVQYRPCHMAANGSSGYFAVSAEL